MSKPLLLTVNGTGVADPFGPGFSADLGRAFAYDPWEALNANMAGVFYGTDLYWQPVGYPAAVIPMGKSVKTGRAEVNQLISMHEHTGLCPKGTPLFLSGYSQGAVITGEVWAQDILSPKGIHHDRVNDVRGVIQFGDPLRCPGYARGNDVAGFPPPSRLDGFVTGGIAGWADLRVEETTDVVLSCALDGDLYACCPVGESPWDTPGKGSGENEPQVGQVETRIYEFIMTGSLLHGIMSIAEGMAEEFGMPVRATIAHIQAIANGLKFAAAGPAAPHWQYQGFIPPLVDWITRQL